MEQEKEQPQRGEEKEESEDAPFRFKAYHKRSLSYSSLSPQIQKKKGGSSNDLLGLTLRHGSCSIQGARKTQEDAHAAVPTLQRPESENVDAEVPYAFFGVYDGHGGDKASEYVCGRLHVLFEQLVHDKVKENGEMETATIEVLAEALRNAILTVEEEYIKKSAKSGDSSGTTAAVVVVKDNKLVIGNVGDSEVVLCDGKKAITLSEVHNPKRNPEEGERVKKVGGTLFQDRVGHPVFNPAIMSIAVSRAIGDYGFKAKEFTGGKPSGLVADPYIDTIELKPRHRFCVLACDGVWDVMSAQDVVNFVLDRLEKGQTDMDQLAKALVDNAYEKGSMDNITASIVVFDWADE
ncbi:PPM-type phosphatase domain-containing protein [Balamuthia mandrillaris]